MVQLKSKMASRERNSFQLVSFEVRKQPHHIETPQKLSTSKVMTSRSRPFKFQFDSSKKVENLGGSHPPCPILQSTPSGAICKQSHTHSPHGLIEIILLWHLALQSLIVMMYIARCMDTGVQKAFRLLHVCFTHSLIKYPGTEFNFGEALAQKLHCRCKQRWGNYQWSHPS